MRPSMLRATGVIWLFSLALAAAALAGCRADRETPAAAPATASTAASSVSPAWKTTWSGRYAEHIQPIFNRHCINCHGPNRSEQGLRLDSHEGVLKGSDYGPVLIPGSAVRSVLISVVDGRTADARIRMPPTGPRLSDVEVQNLITWIEAGAPPQ